MGSLFRSIRYGSWKTRLYLILLLVFLAGGIALIAVGLFGSNLLMLIMGTCSVVIGGAMFIPLQKVLRDPDIDRSEKKNSEPETTQSQGQTLETEGDAKDKPKSSASADNGAADGERELVGEHVGRVSVIGDPQSVEVITADNAKESLMNIKKLLFTDEGADAGVSADELMSEIGKKNKSDRSADRPAAVKHDAESATESDNTGNVAEIDKRGFWLFKRKVSKAAVGKDGEYRGLASDKSEDRAGRKSDKRPDERDTGTSAEDKAKFASDVNPRDAKDPSRPSFYVGREQRVGIKRSARQKRINKEAETKRAGRLMTDEHKRNGDITDQNDELIRGAEKKIDYLKTYTSGNIKKLMKEYKVSKDYVPVIIDRSRRYDINKSPALCWKKGNDINFLVFEAAARVVSVPYFDFRRVTYRHNVSEPEIEAYDYIRKNMASYDMFEDVMPTFNVTGNRLGVAQYSKNLYVFGGVIEVTAASMRALNERFPLEMKLFESLNLKGKYDKYFSDAYESKMLWTDNVISQKAFQDRIRAILQKMVDDDKLMWYDFNDDLTQMIKYKLVTDEYADYFRSRKQMR